MPEIYDCAIVGDGPAGLSCGINLLQRGRSAIVIGLGKSLLQKAEQVDNYLGMQALTGTEMYNEFVSHAKNLNVEIKHGQVSNIFAFNGNFMLNVNGDIITAKSVALAMGVAKSATILGEENLLGKGISYCATCDGMLYRGKRIIVLAQSDDSLHEIEFLHSIGCDITVIANKEIENLPQTTNFIKGKITEIIGETAVSGAIINGETITAEGVFILRDALAPTAILSGLKTEKGMIVADKNCHTNIKNVYAIGDINGKPLQVAKAVSDGLIAALTIDEEL